MRRGQVKWVESCSSEIAAAFAGRVIAGIYFENSFTSQCGKLMVQRGTKNAKRVEEIVLGRCRARNHHRYHLSQVACSSCFSFGLDTQLEHQARTVLPSASPAATRRGLVWTGTCV